MMYIMKKNNVERSVDTEAARQKLEEIGYGVLNTKLETTSEPEKDEIKTAEPKVKKVKKKSE
ncbi:MAG: hypothetical protein K2N34_14895 [Lachnospiraceae bacterium]|nr:hypothetical protein [Lachnospiraceae bacterium]